MHRRIYVEGCGGGGGNTPLWSEIFYQKIVAAFRGMHVSPAKHSSAEVTDGQPDERTDRRRTK